MKVKLKATDGVIYTGTKVEISSSVIILKDVTHGSSVGEMKITEGGEHIYFDRNQIIWNYQTEE